MRLFLLPSLLAGFSFSTQPSSKSLRSLPDYLACTPPNHYYLFLPSAAIQERWMAVYMTWAPWESAFIGRRGADDTTLLPQSGIALLSTSKDLVRYLVRYCGLTDAGYLQSVIHECLVQTETMLEVMFTHNLYSHMYHMQHTFNQGLVLLPPFARSNFWL